VSTKYPNHIWGTGITYVTLKGGFMYPTVVLDWYSRYVLSWSLYGQYIHQASLAELQVQEGAFERL
jgi:transposase InsO family protein